MDEEFASNTIFEYGVDSSSTAYGVSNEFIESVIGYDALYASMGKCRRGVVWKGSVANYCLHGAENTLKLEQSLKDGTYKPGRPEKFKVTHPKERDIISVPFRDRVYQRSLNDNSLYPQISKSLIRDNCACQKGKGTDDARERLKVHLHRAYRKWGADIYVLQCDIKGYYPNMRHDVVLEHFQKRLDPWSYEKAKEILESQYEGDVGYNPGSQMLQIAGISLLDDMDHYIKERLGIKHYMRYMDDFILIHEDWSYLEYCREMIRDWLGSIGFELHEKKTKIYPIKDGITFLGFTFRLSETGKVTMLLKSNNVKAERKKLRRMVAYSKKGGMPHEKVDQSYMCWRSHAERGDSESLLRRMDEFYKGLWED